MLLWRNYQAKLTPSFVQHDGKKKQKAPLWVRVHKCYSQGLLLMNFLLADSTHSVERIAL